MDRREIIKHLSILPFASSMLSMDTFENKSYGPLSSGANIYQSIGVEPVINCVGTYTIIGGSIELPEVVQAMHDASGFFIQYDELGFGIGQRLAEITGAEWGMVSAGCAAGMKHVTAACVTGGNPEKLIRIPDLNGFDKTEVVSPISSRNSYDHAIRNIGVKFITVDTMEDLEKALNSRTAMIYLTTHQIQPDELFPLNVISKIAQQKKIPILVDAAAEDLTLPNIHLQRGATVVAYSGGKALCGPQCAGLLLGNKNILLSAWQASSPHHGPGRDNKVGKEEMMGMLAAVEAWVKRDHVEKMNIWRSYLSVISKKISSLNGITCTIMEPKSLRNHSPSLKISWNPLKFNIDGQQLAEELANNHPRIAVHSNYIDNDEETSITISSGQMQPGNDKVVADQIFKLLTQKRPKQQEMKTPVTNLVGCWDVDIEFFSSIGLHNFYITQQEGNFIEGIHRGDFSNRDMIGIIDGDQIKLKSSFRPTADNVPFTFYGTASSDSMSGKIFMGEYLSAKFVATRNNSNSIHRPILVPKGQPLAT